MLFQYSLLIKNAKNDTKNLNNPSLLVLQSFALKIILLNSSKRLHMVIKNENSIEEKRNHKFSSSRFCIMRVQVQVKIINEEWNVNINHRRSKQNCFLQLNHFRICVYEGVWKMRGGCFSFKISEYIHKTSPLIFLTTFFELPYFIGLNFRANLRKMWKKMRRGWKIRRPKAKRQIWIYDEGRNLHFSLYIAAYGHTDLHTTNTNDILLLRELKT